MTIDQWPARLRPRERLLRLGAGNPVPGGRLFYSLIPAIQMSFGNCMPGPGVAFVVAPDPPACELVPGCTWVFTETVCDPTNCIQPIPILPAYDGCHEPEP